MKATEDVTKSSPSKENDVTSAEASSCFADKTLTEQLGGPEAAMGVLVPSVEIFYTKLLSDEKINHYFEGIDTERLKNKQVEFLAYVFGSPERYTGKDIAEAHEHLIRDQGLNEKHFDIVAGHFYDTLVEMKLPKGIVDQAVDILMTSRPIFERGPGRVDKIGDALKIIRKMKMDQERDIKKIRTNLETLGLKKEMQWEILRSGLKMRDPDVVDFLDSGMS